MIHGKLQSDSYAADVEHHFRWLIVHSHGNSWSCTHRKNSCYKLKRLDHKISWSGTPNIIGVERNQKTLKVRCLIVGEDQRTIDYRWIKGARLECRPWNPPCVRDLKVSHSFGTSNFNNKSCIEVVATNVPVFGSRMQGRGTITIWFVTGLYELGYTGVDVFMFIEELC